MTATKKVVAMCCVSIGYQDYLLPADKGMKLIELFQSAFETEKSFGARGYSYSVGEQPTVELALVRAAQIRPKRQDTNATGQQLLGMDN